MYNHRVRECDELADAVKCQCYALKLLDEKDNLLKSNIAKEAQQNCSESIFFKKWLE